MEVPEREYSRQGRVERPSPSLVLQEAERNVLLIPQQSLYGTFDKPGGPADQRTKGEVNEHGGGTLGSSDDFWVEVRDVRGSRKETALAMESGRTVGYDRVRGFAA